MFTAITATTKIRIGRMAPMDKSFARDVGALGCEVGEGKPHGYSATSSARRALARSFSLSDFSCPQAARMSRPRGVRMGEA